MLLEHAACASLCAIGEAPAPVEHRKLRWISVDLSDIAAVLAVPLLRDVDVVIHLAGSPGVWFSQQHPAEDFRRNVVTLVSVLEALKHRKPHIVLASSWHAGGHSGDGKRSSLYAANKSIAELYLRTFAEQCGLSWTILRMSWIYGPGMSKNPMYDIFAASQQDTLPLFNSLDDALDYIHVDDVAMACLQAATDPAWRGKTLSISSNEAVSVRQLLQWLERRTGKTYAVQAPDGAPKVVRCDNREALALGWSPRQAWSDGIAETYRYVEGMNAWQNSKK